MKIIWHGHSCFSLDTDEGRIVLDPYADGKVTGYPPLRLSADMVLCSHEHDDHNFRDGVSLSGNSCNVVIQKIDTWHDDVFGAKRGKNIIHVLRAEKMRVAHLGDLGCMLSDEQINELHGVDVLLIPIGGFYTIDSSQALELTEKLEPRITIPMHYRFGKHGYDVLSTSEQFHTQCLNPVDYQNNSLTVDLDTPAQTAFLTIS